MRHGNAELPHRAANLLGQAWSLALLGVLAGLGAPAPARAEVSSTQLESTDAQLRASLVEHGPAGPWMLTVTNTGATKIRLSSPQSVALEAQAPPKSAKARKPKAVFCKAPKDEKGKRPRGPELAPGGTLEHTFDPRWYCFDPEGKTPLVPGTAVRLVWGKKFTTNWVTLDPSYDLWRNPPRSSDDSGVNLEVVGSDADDVRSATLTITVRNQTSQKAEVLMRHEAITVLIAGTEGSVLCPAQWSQEESGSESGRWWESSDGVERPRGTLLNPKKHKRAKVRIFELCPRGTLATPGLYRVDVQLPIVSEEEDESAEGNESHLLSSQRLGLVRIRNQLRLPLARRPDSAAQRLPPSVPTNEPFEPPPTAPEPPPPTAIE